MDPTKDTQEFAKNMKNTWAVRLLADCPPRPHRLSARRNLVTRARPLGGQTFLPLPDLPLKPRERYQIIGDNEAPLGDAIPTIL
jgi:hypothetical protein